MQERKMGDLKMRDMKIRDMNIRENKYAGQTYAKSNVYTMKLIKFKLTSGVFRGRATVRWPPPFSPTMKIFYRRLYMKRCVFCHFPARIGKFNNV